MSIVVEIPDSVAEGLRLPNGKRRRGCGASWLPPLSAGTSGLGKAAELAGLSREAFAVELARRDIPRHYSEKDASLDEAYAGR